jgi:cytochrome c553
LIVTVAPPLVHTAEPTGEQIYQTKCANCHGSRGEGTKKYDKRLQGDRSVAQLATVIRKTMPDDDPGSLSQSEAERVATHIYNSFYSPVARERNRPARIELARLTVNQYRQVIGDLIGSFRPPMTWSNQRGLRSEYFRRRMFNPDARIVERIDEQVNFDFGVGPPVPGNIQPHEFLIRWNGSVLAPETGEYEVVVRTEHAARLWINDPNNPLIDAWVKSGKDTEYRGTIFLLAGRVYSLRLEYSKAKQGVDDTGRDKGKPPPVKSSIALLWKRPHGVLETIPGRQLSPSGAPEFYNCATPFPPDDRSYGWERGTTVSRGWDQATTDAALDVAIYLLRHLAEFAGARDDSPDRLQKTKSFLRTFAERAFRRPLTEDEAQWFVDRPFALTKEFDEGVKRAVLRVLKSPRFLYRELNQSPDQYDIASRLSFGLWDSSPDQELLSAAAAGNLGTKDQVAAQAERMLGDRRAKAKLHEFLLNWSQANHGRDLGKDPKRFPGFDAAVIADLRTSLELSLAQVLASDQCDFRQLLLDDSIFLNERLAKFYGVNIPASADFTKVRMDDGQRAGVLTHPYLMTSFAHNRESSPIHRGVFLARGVLGTSLRPPPEAVAPLPPDLHPDLTTRERVALQTKAAACMTCHGVINPLGFTLEHFDAVGRYREKENAKQIDATGSYLTRDGKTVVLNGARELAEFLAGSEEAQTAFVEQMFHNLVQQPTRAYGPNTLKNLQEKFVANGCNMRRLAVEIMTISALKPRDSASAASETGKTPEATKPDH